MPSLKRRQALGLLATAPLAAALGSAPAAQAFTGLIGPYDPIAVPGFTDLGPVILPAGGVEVETVRARNDVHDPFALVDVARSWARQRFAAAGGRGVARVVIQPRLTKRVDYRSVPEPFGGADLRRIDIFTADLAVAVYGAGGDLWGQSVADERIRVTEDSLTTDRRARLARLMERVTRELDGQLIGQLRPGG